MINGLRFSIRFVVTGTGLTALNMYQVLKFFEEKCNDLSLEIGPFVQSSGDQALKDDFWSSKYLVRENCIFTLAIKTIGSQDFKQVKAQIVEATAKLVVFLEQLDIMTVSFAVLIEGIFIPQSFEVKDCVILDEQGFKKVIQRIVSEICFLQGKATRFPQRRIAEATNISTPQLNRWLSGGNSLGQLNLISIAMFLLSNSDVSVDIKEELNKFLIPKPKSLNQSASIPAASFEKEYGVIDEQGLKDLVKRIISIRDPNDKQRRKKIVSQREIAQAVSVNLVYMTDWLVRTRSFSQKKLISIVDFLFYHPGVSDEIKDELKRLLIKKA